MSKQNEGARSARTFQQIVSDLQGFWADQGCLIWQPHNAEVGAGTMNPATFLAVLGPEPWNVAYVEPSIRPDDARYGENPNRMGRHHQFQVILKPDPGNPQELYLASLEAIGIDLEKHDIRFVEDNWESPALGAWGLGWEVWLDGLEITQFTYFQQAGSLDLEPNSVEITYGLDRILMALQDVRHFKDLSWNERVNFGDVLMSYEQQTSAYYFEHADVDRLRQMYDINEAEANMALDHGLVRPAHDLVLRCSHLFNVLDARGSIGVTERAGYFGRMRSLARRVAEGYIVERQEQEYPLGDDPKAQTWVAGAEKRAASDEGPGEGSSPAEDSLDSLSLPGGAADFVLEIGCEELPPTDLDRYLQGLEERAAKILTENRLAYSELKVSGTPRRIALQVSGLADRQEDIEEQVVGPPLKAAFKPDGTPTGAAIGFAKSAGVEVADLEQVEQKGDMRVAALKREAGQPASTVLAEVLPALISGLPAGRTMRWNASGERFSRPIRWLLALHGPAIVPIALAGLRAGRISYGLRPNSAALQLADASDYPKLMRSSGIVLSGADRQAQILSQIEKLASEVGGSVPADSKLLSEVGHLVEQPYGIRGDFEAEYLDLPDAVLTTVMKKHQRYFPIVDAEQKLMPHFITIASRAGLNPDAVRHGNESVIRARFADAAYFWKQDRGQKLEAFSAGLAKLSFQADLGSVLDKVRRLEKLAPDLGQALGLDAKDLAHTARAASLSKSDLASSMVVDFTSLQGTMGREYARLSGEEDAVAEAIYEQYLPRGANEEMPSSPAGIALALADRFDSLVGLFAAGLRPKGANDPYALRRAALGITGILVSRDLDLDLKAAIDAATAELPIKADEEVRAELLHFLARRLEVLLRDRGHAADAVASVLAVQSRRPANAAKAIAILEQAVAEESWEDTLTAYARCKRIVRGQSDVPNSIDPSRLAVAEEQSLHAALETLNADLDRSDMHAVLAGLQSLTPHINAFFEAVLVMDDDPAIRSNRLALVGALAGLPNEVADLSLMEGF